MEESDSHHVAERGKLSNENGQRALRHWPDAGHVLKFGNVRSSTVEGSVVIVQVTGVKASENLCRIILYFDN